MTKTKRPKRPREINEAVLQLRAASRQELAKKEVVQFRMDTEDLERLYQVCAKHKKPVGTLVREWVLAMTARELITTRVSWANSMIDDDPLFVSERTVDELALFADDSKLSKSQKQKLQKIYERLLSCRKEEMALTQDLFGIMLNLIK